MTHVCPMTLSNFPFDFDTIFVLYILEIFNNHQVLENKSGYEHEQDSIL